jgi:hypothetical protein
MFATFGNIAGVEGRYALRPAGLLDKFPVEKRKVEGLPKVLPVAAFIVGAVAPHVFKVVPSPHGKEKMKDVAEKIPAPLVHPRHFAQYCIDGSCTHWVIVLRSSCGKLKLRIFTLFFP